MARRLGERVRFGRYEALLRLGAGGMAEVFAARLTGEGGFHKLVAIKRMLPHLADDPELVERFFDEARIAANIVSPHVVRTLDVGRSEDGAPFIVMELIVGVTLTDLFYEEREGAPQLPLPVALELLAQIADGLADAHAARLPDGRELSVVHRDVSPQNVLVGADGRARLTDFGIARALDQKARTATGRVFGKLAYMAPEQMRGERVTARSDVFSLGVVAWEVIAGRRLYGTDERDDAPAPRLERMRDGLPEEVAAIVASALETDPSARCASAADLARGLRRSAHRLGPAPDLRTLARHVAETGGRALAEVQRRITLATAPPDEGDVTRTGAVVGIDVADPETAVTDPDTTLEIIDVDATIVSDELDGAVNVSGEQTWSSGGTRAVDLGAEPTEQARNLHAVTTAPLAVRSISPAVDAPKRSRRTRLLLPAAVILLVAGIGLGAWVGTRGEPEDSRAIVGDGWIAVPLDPPGGPAAPTGDDTDDTDGTDVTDVTAEAEDGAARDDTATASPDRAVARDGERGAATDDAPASSRRPRRGPRRRPASPPTSSSTPPDEPTMQPTELEPGMLLGAERYPEGGE